MKNVSTDSSDPVVEPVVPESSVVPDLIRAQQAMKLVKGYVPWSAGAGILPLPFLDMTALVAIQLHMLSKLSEIYHVPFKENGVKSIVSTLVGTVFSTSVGAAMGSLVKVVPFVGTIASFVAVPGMYSAATYAVGRVFVTHFEAGGTFLDFDPQKTRDYFVAEFEKAKAQPDLTKAA